MESKREKKRLFDWDGGFYGYIEKLFDAIALSLLWLLCSLPILTLGASTAALYYTTVKNLRKDRGHLFECFWHSFRENLKQGTILWLIFLVLILLTRINQNIVPDIDGGYFGLFLQCLYTFLLFFLFAVMLYAFAALSRFHMGVGWLLKLSIYMTVRYFFTTLAVLAAAVAAALALYVFPYFVMIVPAGAALAISFFMERVLLRHTPEPGFTEKAAYQWYR